MDVHEPSVSNPPSLSTGLPCPVLSGVLLLLPVTKPSAAMRAAMASCEVGDDVFGDDVTVIRLEERVAAMFEHEGEVR
jgi:hypothetical protein